MEHNKIYHIGLKNRWTGKRYDKSWRGSINLVFNIQDEYIMQPWIKVVVI